MLHWIALAPANSEFTSFVKYMQIQYKHLCVLDDRKFKCCKRVLSMLYLVPIDFITVSLCHQVTKQCWAWILQMIDMLSILHGERLVFPMFVYSLKACKCIFVSFISTYEMSLICRRYFGLLCQTNSLNSFQFKCDMERWNHFDLVLVSLLHLQ